MRKKSDPSMTPCVPLPGSALKFFTGSVERFSSAKCSAMARLTGCELMAARLAASSIARFLSTVLVSVMLLKEGLPLVTVPVLSRQTFLRVRPASRYTPPLINTPRRAAAETAETMVTGVEITRAQGQEITSSTRAR